MTSPITSWQLRVEREVERLHVFFEAWLGGSLPHTELGFEPLEHALGANFEMVVPSGVELGREALVKSLFAAHGSCPEISIRIAGCRLLSQLATDFDQGLLVARYEEIQTVKGSHTSSRLSTVVLNARPGQDQLCWLRVHETWVSPDR